MAFFWNYTLKLDDKGRITIPSEYKNSMEKDFNTTQVAVVHGVVKQKCLVVYPHNTWIQKMSKLIQSSSDKQDSRDILKYRRYLASNTYQKELDKNGKLLIPPRLWNKIDVPAIHGGIEMVIVGNFDFFEVWLNSRWEEYQTQSIESENIDAEAFLHLGKDENAS